MIPPPVYPGVPLGPARCQHCGALLTTVPAQDAPKDVSADRGPQPVKDANIVQEDAPSGYMSRDKLL